MSSLAAQPRPRFQLLYLTGLIMPYFTVWLGLYIFKNAWAAVLGYHIGIILLVTLAGAWPSPVKFRPERDALEAHPLWPDRLHRGRIGLRSVAVHPCFAKAGESLLDWGLTPRAWPLFIVYGTLVNPWLEETFWRGWLGSASRQPILHDAAFAGFHLVILAPFFPFTWLAIAFAVLAVSGWMWRQVIRVEKSMLASTLFHMAADVSILLVVLSEVT